MKAQTIIDKIWDSHIVIQNSGHPAILAIDYMLIHEVTSAQAFDELKKRGLPLYDKERLLATLDHSIPTSPHRDVIEDPAARRQVETLRSNAKSNKLKIYDYESGNQGIVHVIGPELGITQPGMTIVCGDSHTSTHGAFGAMAFGIGTTEVGYVMGTSCILQVKPKTMRVQFKGMPAGSIHAKDVILKLISQIGIGGGTGHIIEYTGEFISSLSMEERMTLCNMSIECGARAGLVAPDDITFEYLKGKKFAPTGERWDEAVAHWRSLCTDEKATFDSSVTVDITDLKPFVTWGTNPSQGIQIDQEIPEVTNLPAHEQQAARNALAYTGLRGGTPISGTPIQWAFLGSCTNGRLSDLRIAAEILQGKKIHPSVTFYIVPGSEQVRADAEKEGLDKIFIEAGADWRMPGCSMCLGMNDDKVPAGSRCISSSNRNFVGRQGTGSITHLAAPATVAASAVAGVICAEL